MENLKRYKVGIINLRTVNIAAYNPRVKFNKGDPEYEQLKESLEELGYLQFILWNEATNNIVSGNFKAQIFLDEGVTEAEAIIINEPNLIKEKAINIRLNRHEGRFDKELIPGLLAEIAESEIPAELTGFSTEEIERILKEAELDIDAFFEVAETEKEPEKEERQIVICPHCNKEFEVT